MKIALFGKGKMGTLIEELALSQGHTLTPLEEADVAIDFSHHSVVLKHLKECLKAGKPLVIGTTGWDSEEQEARKLVQTHSGACLYSPNFSIGIFLFERLLGQFSKMVKFFPDYDVAGVESHHKHKADSPSGTAKLLRKKVMEEIPHLEELSFSSVRCGFDPGTHTLIFDSDVDTITLSHKARSREGFAKGALFAAEWMVGKKGFFGFSDLFDSLMEGKNDV